jgi:LysM repeat protein
MIGPRMRSHRLATTCVVLAASILLAAPAFSAGVRLPAAADTAAPIEASEFSPAFLGMYRKVMEIEDDILRYSKKYGVDPQLARAVCMYESGGNGDLTSGAGAHGYFQVMPATFRLMKVSTNIEAGIKYLSQMIEQFDREDYALAAYNGGPGRVARGRAMPLESLQYVLGVGYYRSVLKMYESSVRIHAAALQLTRSKAGDTWWTLSRRLEVPVIQLRLFNAFISDLRLARGTHLIAYPIAPVSGLVQVTEEEDTVEYRSRLGDNYINVAFAFGVDVDELRGENALWRLQQLPPDMVLTIPLDRAETMTEQRVSAGEDLLQFAARVSADPWQLVRDNNLWDEDVQPGMVLRVRVPSPRPAARVAKPRPAPRPAFRTHVVARGENLTEISRRYGTSVAAIQRANSLGRRSLIRVGQRLRIPTS